MAVIPDEGEQWIIDKLQNVAPLTNALMNILGTGSGATAESDTVTLATISANETSETRVTGTLSQPTADVDRMVATQTYTGTKNITQAFRTNTTTKGDAGQRILFYALFTAIPVENGDQIVFTLDNQAT